MTGHASATEIDQSAPAARSAGATGSGGLATSVLVEDGVEVAPGQMTRSHFFARLDARVREAVDAALGPVGRTSADCPYLERYLAHYRRQPLDHINRAVHLYARPGRDEPDQWLAAIARRAGAAAEAWRDGVADPFVQEISPTGFADLAASAERSAAGQSLRELGPGQRLPSKTRVLAERAFGVGLSHVRVHVDEAAQRIADRTGSVAFAIGDHIGFGAGSYRPGTLGTDAVLAHEIAHTMQQRAAIAPAEPATSTGAVEDDATRTAQAAGDQLRANGGTTTIAPRWSSGLALRSCSDDVDETVPAAPSTLAADTEDVLAVAEQAPTEPAPAGAGGATGTAATDVAIDDLTDWTWTPEADANAGVIIVGEVAGSAPGPHLFLIPARGLLQRGAPPGGATGRATPQRGPLVRMPATGHAGAHLVHTSHGLAAMVDAGGQRTGGPSAVQVASIQAVATRFGMTRVNEILPAHTHADHVANITALVQAGVVRAANVHVNPGLQNAAAGPLGQVLTALRSPQHAAAGFGPAWTPTQLSVREVPGPQGASTMQSQLRIGGAVLDTVVDSAQMRAFTAAMQSGDWKQATRVADAASLMTRISGASGGPQMLVTGDMRGRDILRVQQAMGEPAFRTFVEGARTLSGLHHLGAVGTTADVRGLQALLRAMGSASNQITVVAQTGNRGEINMELVRALQQSGVRVVALGAALGRADQQITVGSSGRVLGQGAAEWAPDPSTRAAGDRLRQLERAIRAIEATPTYRSGQGLGREQTLTGLRAEVQRLRTLLETRMELATDQLTTTTRRPDAAQRLADNARSIAEKSAAERTLGDPEVLRLSRSAEAAGRLSSELRRAERGGYARHEVRRLVFEVDPETARRILADELGNAQSRRQQRRGWRAAAKRLRRQAEVNRIVANSGGGTPRARAVAWFGLALEAWNLASPFLADAINDSRDATQRDFYMFWRDLTWWQEKGLRPVYRAFAGGSALEQSQIAPGVQKRLHEDMTEEQRNQISLSDEAQNAAAVQQLVIAPVNEWPEGEQRTFWTTLMLWISTHINNYDDYAAEIGDLSWAPIRQAPGGEGSFGERNWQLRVGVVDDDGHVQERWQDSPDLTRIMNATARRVVATTNRELGARWERRHEGRSEGPVVSAPGTRLAPQRHEQPTTIRGFAGGNKPVYEYYGSSVRRLHTFRFWNDSPRFFVHTGMWAPKGYVWVSGGDYNTAAAIRSQDVSLVVASVQIPRQPTRALPGETLPPSQEQYMTRDQLFVWRAYVDRRPGFTFTETPDDRGYRGYVQYHESGRNESGMLLVEVDSLSNAPIASSDMPWGRSKE